MPAAAILAVVVAGFVVLDAAALVVVRRSLRAPARALARSVLRHVRRPVQLLVPLVALEIALTAVRLPSQLRSDLLRGVGVLVVLACAFLVVRLTAVLEELLLSHYRTDTPDNLRARQVHTQIQVLRRVVVFAVAVVALAIVLLSIPAVRAAGAGLLASAGIAGVVAGVAAKPTVANVVAGIQIAISQPIRVDDVVVVEGHWGRIEQIALTYVVVRIWDLRRLVLPISYFVEQPFENWTKSRADLIGWVHLEVDFSAPVDELRTELHRILRASPDWDGNVWSLQVTQAGTSTMQLRALMSAKDSSTAWNLQCAVREQLIDYLRRHHPGALPRLRTTAGPDPALEQSAGDEQSAHGPAGTLGRLLEGTPPGAAAAASSRPASGVPGNGGPGRESPGP
jgi:small-conductance mechanosensitive channel